MAEAPIAQPWPGSVDGARALVEAWMVLTRQVGGGGSGFQGARLKVVTPPTTKSKRPSVIS